MADMKNYIGKLVAVRNCKGTRWKVSILKGILPDGHFEVQETLSNEDCDVLHENYEILYKYCRPLTEKEIDRLL